MLDVVSTQGPQYTEPLPSYSRHEPDATSVRSAAPSYESDRPPYDPQQSPTSLLPPVDETHEQRPTGLPSPLFAPGFENRANSAFYEQNLDLSSLSNMQTSNNARQFQNIARRRAKQDWQTMEEMLNSLSSVPMPRANALRTSSASSASSAQPPITSPYPFLPNSPSPANLLEDPHLVGVDAAMQARTEREQREMVTKREQTRQLEDRSWDFMASQMADWEERDRSWNSFRTRVGGSRAKGARRRWRLGPGRSV